MNDGGAGGGLIGSLLGAAGIGMMALVVVGLVILMGLPQYTISQKLGHDKPWMAWIPIANAVQLFNLADLSGWLILLILIPFLGALAILGLFIYSWMKVAEKMGHPGWLGLLMLVPVLGVAVPFYIAFATPTQAQRY